MADCKSESNVNSSSFFPPEWYDNDRMNFMFSAFPENRNLNSKHWDSKINFWKNVLEQSCKVLNEMYFDCGTLKQRFNRNGTSPLGLNVVVKECVKNGMIVPVNDLLEALDDSWLSWSFGLAKKSLSWSVNLIWSSTYDKDLPGQFVLVDLLKEKSDKLLNEHYMLAECDTTDHIIPWNVLKNRWSKIDNKNDEKSLELVVCYLKTQRKITLVQTPEGEKIVKFAVKNQSKPSIITEVDLGIVSLKKTIASLKLQVMKLEKEMNSLVDKASLSVKQRKKNAAKKLLQKKQQHQKVLEKKENCLEAMQGILRKIQEAESDKMIISAYQSGSLALKNALEGMKADDVDKIIDDIEETIQEASELDTTICEGNKRIEAATGFDVDMDELERELQELKIHEDDQAKTETENKTPRTQVQIPDTGVSHGPSLAQSNLEEMLDKLPDVPSDSIFTEHIPRRKQPEHVLIQS